jgi:trimethylamine:corrinoid methyltransferase-like protein
MRVTQEEISMSYPYPQDRHLDRKEKGDQPYKDAREAMSQNEAQIQAEAEAFGEENLRLTDEERQEQLESEARDLLRKVGASRENSTAEDAGTTSGAS